MATIYIYAVHPSLQCLVLRNRYGPAFAGLRPFVPIIFMTCVICFILISCCVDVLFFFYVK